MRPVLEVFSAFLLGRAVAELTNGATVVTQLTVLGFVLMVWVAVCHLLFPEKSE